MNHYGLLQTISSANKNTKYKVELSYGETILIKRNRGPIDTMGQQKNLKSLQNVRHNLRNLRKIRKLWKMYKNMFLLQKHGPRMAPTILQDTCTSLHDTAWYAHESCTILTRNYF